MTGRRGTCQVCYGDYALVPSTGRIRRHTRMPEGQPPTVGKQLCAGSGHEPARHVGYLED